MCRGHGDSVFNALQTSRRGPAHSRRSGAAPGQTWEQLRPGSRTDPAHLRPDLTALAPLERCDERAALWGPEMGRRFAAPGASGCQSPRPYLLGGSARPPKTDSQDPCFHGVFTEVRISAAKPMLHVMDGHGTFALTAGHVCTSVRGSCGASPTAEPLSYAGSLLRPGSVIIRPGSLVLGSQGSRGHSWLP